MVIILLLGTEPKKEGEIYLLRGSYTNNYINTAYKFPYAY